VIIASWLGLPVSTTYIAVFGVGFFREWYTENSTRRAEYIARHQLNTGGGEARKGHIAEQRRHRLVRRSHYLSSPPG
jgi:PiT family inorganic phosphate transporter